MRVARSLEEAAQFEPVAVTIGNFDGVHIGHQQLLHEVKRAASEKGLQPAVLTFDPHPSVLLRPDDVPPALTTLSERTELLGRYGANFVIALPVDRSFLQMTAEQFFQQIVREQLEARGQIGRAHV